ncbi:hypothetical protein [Promicromonospora umidemergens]|uniref:MerR-like DNA binding protein n=1 Tax=Promicromonospora umidemergens TaxID=629679 RepID=A0ABP8WI59_9MICO|nr:hypothetical protein [Promicromonospora umidemergens]
MSDDVVTPADLARKLGLSPKTVRAWLRAEYNTLDSRGSEARWHLTDEQVAHVQRRAAGRWREKTR